MKWSKKALLAKIESSYGVDPTPTGAANAQLIFGSDVSLTPIAAEAREREVVRVGGEYGSFLQFVLGKHVMLEFSVEMAGAGAVDTAPKYGPLLRACGLAETITPTTGPVEYDPVSESFDSVTIYMHIDGILHKMTGARGNAVWQLNINDRPSIRFRMLGLFVAIADASFPTPDYSGFQQVLPVTDSNTPTLTLHGTAVKVASLSIDLGNRVEYRELVNSTEIVISDRRARGQITFEHVVVATKDWFGAVTAETLAALAVVHGAGAGKVCKLDAPKVQLLTPRLSGSQDLTMLALDLNLTPDAGDDEFKFTTQ
jgi:hypothetical protein